MSKSIVDVILFIGIGLLALELKERATGVLCKLIIKIVKYSVGSKLVLWVCGILVSGIVILLETVTVIVVIGRLVVAGINFLFDIVTVIVWFLDCVMVTRALRAKIENEILFLTSG